eukprot:TRINITY_DN3934_c1_g1_i1.p1 TRINITY_DN3934_c1_g1~~TRINITY_DN3934_c1_g1_i1.p1  ORF type:complete len:1503 (+),score=153.90 TRINITY_DN3934_c1_g1_i1:24-4532(+)
MSTGWLLPNSPVSAKEKSRSPRANHDIIAQRTPSELSHYDESRKKVLYHKTEISQDGTGLSRKELEVAAKRIMEALEIRERYQTVVNGVGSEKTLGKIPSNTKFFMKDGVVTFEGCIPTVDYDQYVKDVSTIFDTVENGPTRSTCRNRLKILDEKYAIYIALNSEVEENVCPMRKGGGVFSSCTKVDNSVRLSTAMHAQDLLDYIVKTYETSPNTVVSVKGAQKTTLKDVFDKYDIHEPREFTIEGVGLHPPVQKRFHRFDIFSKDTNRGGERSAEVLKLFLKREMPFYHNLVKPILDLNDLEFNEKRIATEYKLPIFGTSAGEWQSLAKWVCETGVSGHKVNRWIIQIPRIAALRFTYTVATTQEQLDNIFLPLWEASLNSDDPKYSNLAKFLLEVGAFNVISDEQVRGQELPRNRPPDQWPWSENPPDLYFNFYVFANITALNHLRRRNGLNTFTFRPNCGEQGKLDQLVMGYLLADSINHGITMERSTVLQYLFYMSQVGIVLSPLASNGLGNPIYHENPFLRFQKRGMRVSLGTDDPLHYHHSRHPCLEEYGTASKLYRLGPVDMTEIARNSVRNSGFPEEQKREWLGARYSEGSSANDQTKSFVPTIRLVFREDTLSHERKLLLDTIHASSPQGTSIKPSRGTSFRRISSVSSSGRPGNIAEERIAFPRVDIISPGSSNFDAATITAAAEAAKQIALCVRLRLKYIDTQKQEVVEWRRTRNGNPIREESNEFAADTSWECIPKGGVFRYKRKSQNDDVFNPVGLMDLETFFKDFNTIHDIVENIHVKTMCHRRLQVLEHKFTLHMALNMKLENAAEDGGQSRDFYQASKVDTHIHAAAGMTARQLLEFIIDKAQNCLDDIVQVDKTTASPITLRQLLKKLNISPSNLSVDTLNVQADATLFERFDNFNDKYNPMGNPDLRNLFLKTDNYMNGRYFAELAKSTFAQYTHDQYTYAEMRLSIYGRAGNEWTKLAAWFDTHGMASVHNKWMIQVPRIYPIFRKIGAINSFQGLLSNIFEPLWKVSLDPASDPKLHHFLKHMSGFDSVDNESTPDIAFPLVPPSEWTSPENPPYGYWMYFMWANIKSINVFRRSKGLSTFSFRPHCGESGLADHLMFCYLTADHINHGVNLRLDPVLEYMYYISQIGIAVSPLSNNSLFLDYLQNPFPMFFRRGLYVSLSTDDPLQFHHTQEPLIEEYSIASKVWKLNANDMCEIARNSVMQSGFDMDVKTRLVGDNWILTSSKGNDSKKTHLSNIRVAYRYETYHSEIECMEESAGGPIFDGLRAKFTIDEEHDLLSSVDGSDLNQHEEAFSPSGDSASPSVSTEPGLVVSLQNENTDLKNELQKLREALTRVSDDVKEFSSPTPPTPPPPAVVQHGPIGRSNSDDRSNSAARHQQRLPRNHDQGSRYHGLWQRGPPLPPSAVSRGSNGGLPTLPPRLPNSAGASRRPPKEYSNGNHVMTTNSWTLPLPPPPPPAQALRSPPSAKPHNGGADMKLPNSLR